MFRRSQMNVLRARVCGPWPYNTRSCDAARDVGPATLYAGPTVTVERKSRQTYANEPGVRQTVLVEPRRPRPFRSNRATEY